MRRTLMIAGGAMLALLAALGTFVPAVTEAAPAAQYTSVTGTLVATPQSTLPATLALQVNDQTIPVTITASTQVVDSGGNALSLSVLTDGDTLQVTGDMNAAGGIDASSVQDLSRSVTTPPTTTYQVTGTLATGFSSGLCLQNASVVAGASPSITTASPCPSGELPVYLTGGTTYENAYGSGIALSSLQIGDSLEATGTLSGGLFTASLVQDFTQSTTTGGTYQVTGTLATGFSSGLCLQNASVVSGASPNITTASPCPYGELPVYLAGGTSLEDVNGNAIALSTLQIGDSLEATGTLSGGLFTASLVQDLSRSVTTPQTTSYYQVTGTLVTEFSGGLCLQYASVVGGASPNITTASPCPYGELPVYLSGLTAYENAYGSPIVLASLQGGDSLDVMGILSGGQFTAAQVQDLSYQVSYTTNQTPATTVQTPATAVQTSYTTLVGTVWSTRFSGGNRCVTLQVQQGPMSGTITICLQTSTQVFGRNAARARYTAIHRGEVLTVQGVYNRHNHRWMSTQRISIH